MKRIRSGVDAPEGKVGVCGERREGLDGAWMLVVGERGEGELIVPMVVVRCACVVSADGGGGRFCMMAEGLRIAARQRKHSPVPK